MTDDIVNECYWGSLQPCFLKVRLIEIVKWWLPSTGEMGEIQKIGSKGANFQLQEELSSEDLKYGTDNGIILYTLKL